MASESSIHLDESIHGNPDGMNWSSFYMESLCDSISKLKLEGYPHELKVFECYKNVDIRNKLTEYLQTYLLLNQPGSKSAKKSSELRLKGNEHFQEGDDETSLQKYNESVIHAPHGSRELSLALGNRSAALYRLKRFEECIADIDLAMKNHQLDVINLKLVKRRNAAQAQIHNEKSESVDTKALFSVSYGPNPAIQYASSLVELSGSASNRSVIASDKIEFGDVLFVEKPFSFVIQSHFLEEYCQYCCQPLKNLFACSQCTEYLFCSESCFTQAFNSFHKWECKGRYLLQSIGAAHLAFNSVMIASHCSSTSNDLFENQITHIDDIPADDLELYVTTATLLVIYLELYTDFFVVTTREKSIARTGFDFLKQTLAIICNAFNLSRTADNRNGFENLDLSQQVFAMGVFPSAALINHSCEPNINIIFLNDKLVIRALRDICKGEEIFHSYDPKFAITEREERQEILKGQYHFDCKCTRCVREDIENDSTCPRCKNLSYMDGIQEPLTKCQHCGKQIHVSTHSVEYFANDALAALDFQSEVYRTRLKSYSKCIETLRHIYGAYSLDHAMSIKKLIDSCLLNMKENVYDNHNFKIIMPYFEEFLEIVKFNFGCCSVEYGISLEKKLDLIRSIELNNS